MDVDDDRLSDSLLRTPDGERDDGTSSLTGAQLDAYLNAGTDSDPDATQPLNNNAMHAIINTYSQQVEVGGTSVDATITSRDRDTRTTQRMTQHTPPPSGSRAQQGRTGPTTTSSAGKAPRLGLNRTTTPSSGSLLHQLPSRANHNPDKTRQRSPHTDRSRSVDRHGQQDQAHDRRSKSHSHHWDRRSSSHRADNRRSPTRAEHRLSPARAEHRHSPTRVDRRLSPARADHHNPPTRTHTPARTHSSGRDRSGSSGRKAPFIKPQGFMGKRTDSTRKQRGDRTTNVT
jgi:hypothetical protein